MPGAGSGNALTTVSVVICRHEPGCYPAHPTHVPVPGSASSRSSGIGR